MSFPITRNGSSQQRSTGNSIAAIERLLFAQDCNCAQER
jgi:hypothetical protein